MAGAIAPNLHEGSRSEILADYLFSTWGTVTPVRRQDDYGIDLFCTLTKRIGQRAFVTDHYSVQVKSTTDPWVLEGNDSVEWLANHPTPLYLACVDKGGAQLSIYRTAARFLAAMWPHDRLVLTPAVGDEGHCPQWRDPANFDLSAPILRVGLADLNDATRLSELRQVFEYWVGVDRDQCAMRRMGLLRVREPDRYRVNEIPNYGTVEQGMTMPTKQQLRAGIETVVEALDCVGHQALVEGDRTFALHAALLLHHIRTTRSDLNDHPVWGRPDSRWGLEHHIVRVLDPALLGERQPTWAFESLTMAVEQVRSTPAFARLNGIPE